MASMFYLLGLGFLVVSIGACTTGNSIGGLAHMLAWVMCWVGGGIIERLPAPEGRRIGLSAPKVAPPAGPATLTAGDREKMAQFGIAWKNGEFHVGGVHFVRLSDAVAAARAASPNA